MDMESNKRRNIGILGSIGVHIVVFLVIAFTGLLHYSAHKEDIVEIAFFGGGGGGGGSGVEAGVEEVIEEESTPDEAEEVAETEPDAIYQQTKDTKPVVTHKAKRQAPKAAASAGKGTGHGSGTGSGTGPGSGSGSGGGHGSGHGTGTGSGTGSGNGNNAVPGIPPRVTYRPDPPYPSAERNAGIEGSVKLRFIIGYNGEIEDITIIESSGNANLDNAAVNGCRKWRFKGARNSANQKVRSYAYQTITFSLENK